MENWLTADRHHEPGDDATEGQTYIDGRLIHLGDFFNDLPFNRKRWFTKEGQYTADSVGGLAEEVLIFPGNHDPLPFLKLIKFPKNVTVYPKYELKTEHLLLCHGHQFTYWKWLAKVAPQFCDWATGKKWWYKFCQKQGWVTSEHHPESGFSSIMLAFFGACLKYCEDNKISARVGHIHSKQFQIDEVDKWTFESVYVQPEKLTEHDRWGFITQDLIDLEVQIHAEPIMAAA